MGILSKINEKRKQAQKKIFNPIVKGISKVSDKLIPNELRWAMPYAAGIGSLMLPPGWGPYMRGLASAGINVAGQIAADETPIEDISDINALSAAIAGGIGALGSDQVSGAMRSGIERPMAAGPQEYLQEAARNQSDIGFLQGAENIGREGIAAASDYITGARETLAGLGRNPKKLYTLGGIKDAGMALGPTISHGTGDVFREMAIDYQDEADRLRAEEEAEWEATEVASDSKRAEYQMTFMRQAGIGEDEIKETLESNELGDYYEPPVEAAQGGRIGYADAGSVRKDPYDVAEIIGGEYQDRGIGTWWPFSLIKSDRAEDAGAEMVEEMQDWKYGKSFPGETIGKIFENEGFQIKPKPDRPPMSMEDMIESLEAKWDEEGPSWDFEKMGIWDKEHIRRRIELGWDQAKGPTTNRGIMAAAQGGIIGLKHGGMLNFGGREMDLRTGGFVPIGRKERADDVPARLSKNEFVMTADAVRAAGGGSVNKGAQRMYDVMNKLEARA